MTIYLDASAIVPTLLPEKSTPIIEAFLRRLDERLVVSDLAAGEVASAVARRLRMNFLDRLTAEKILAAFDAWQVGDTVSIEIEPIDLRQAARFVRRFDLGLRMPDAIHAATCERLGLTLVTLDLPLAGAARSLGIDIVVPA